MRRLRNFGMVSVGKLGGLALGVWVGLAGSAAWAQPANDFFADAEDISEINAGLWGSVDTDLTEATSEVGEPSHAGFPAFATVWYKWTAPKDGEVQLDTLSSPTGAETVLAVYTGNTVSTLRQVAANDDLFPVRQSNIRGNRSFNQPYNGPSGLRFNARFGTTYYFAIGGKFSGGPVTFGWAYHSAGVFRFATEDAVSYLDLETFQFVTRPVFLCSEAESSQDSASTSETYYDFGVPGVLVTVTRMAGSSGRMLVDYATEDILPEAALPGDTPAEAFFDYFPVQGTLVFDDFEMTKRIVIPIYWDGYEGRSNRNFAVVLSDPRPDDAESPNVSPPRLDGAYSRAIVRILDLDLDPVWARNWQADPDEEAEEPMDIFGWTTNSVFNFQRVAYRTPEDVSGYWQLRVWVGRFGTNREAVTLHYRINNFLGSDESTAELDNNTFPLQPGSDYATTTPATAGIGILAGESDFEATGNYSFPGGGTLSWAQDDFRWKPIDFVVTNDVLTEFNEDFEIFLYRIVDNRVRVMGMVNEACVTILFDDQDPPAGSVDQLHNADFGARMAPAVITTPPNQERPGADSVVYGLAVQPDNKTVIVGDFQSFNATPRNRIARLNLNGSLDTSFNPGSGANDFIGAIARTPSGQFVVGGGFTSFNGTPRVRVARLNGNGGLDAGFNPGAGPNNTVWALTTQADGKVIIAGEFTSVNNVARRYIARLNTNGVLDTTFDPGPNGPDGMIWAVAQQSDGKVIIGGEFQTIAGQAVGGIARLNADGSLDTSFFPGAGTDGIVYALALQSDGKVVVGGEFSLFDFNPRKNLVRLNADGSLDDTFDPGSSGADGTVYSITVAGDRLYVGGSFLKFNGTHRRGFTRLYADGTVDTGFLDPAYNQFAGLHRARFSDPPGIVFAAGVQSDGNVMIAGLFEQVGGGQADIITRPETYDPYVWTETKARDGVRNRRNVARLIGGTTPGPGNISLTADTHTANENQSSLSVSLTRTNGTLGFLSANFEVEAGLAQSGVDYLYHAIPPIYLTSWRLGFPSSEPNVTTRMRSDGLWDDNFVPTSIYGHQWFAYTPGNLVVTVLNDNLTQGDRNTTFRLANPTAADQFYLGGENIPLGGALGRSVAPWTIIDDDKRSGVLGFATANFVVNENVGNAVVTVTRTNGSYGSVSCQYATVPGGSATAGVDYQLRSGTLTFANGQTSRTFTIPISNDTSVEPDETIALLLSGPTGGATLGLNNAVVTIVDNDTPGGKLNFTSTAFATNENAGAAIITVARSGSSSGTLTVQVGATNGTALEGVDFIGVTNLLTWPDGDVTPRTIAVPLLDNTAIEPDKTVNLRLFNPTLNSLPNLASLGSIANATLTIVNDDLSGQVLFSTQVYRANENGGPAIVTVVRTGGSAESVAVNFSASGGTAVPVVDYIPTNGTLSFGPGELSKSFAVPIVDNQFPDVARFVTLTLSGESPSGVLGFPSTAILNLVDDESVNEPPGGIDTQFTGQGMNDAVFALALQGDGQILAGGDFTQVNLVPRARVVRFNAADGAVDPAFQASANGAVRAVVPQTNGRILLGGAFTAINGVVRNYLARVNPNGSVDTSFNPGSGADNPLFAVAEAFLGSDRKIFIGGGFTVFNGVARNGIARLNDDGSLDTAFDPGLGANGVVYAIAAYPTNTTHAGKVLIAGDFASVNGIPRNRIARLNADGSVDATFDPGTGADEAIRALAIQLDGRILIGGSFTSYNGTDLNRFARLNANGSVDPTFAPGVGANDTVTSITVQGDTRIVLGGQFTRCNGVTRNHVTRLNNDGTVDPTINFGAGANDFVAATVVQPDGKIIIGGGFSEYDGTPRQRIARIYGGSMAGSGVFEFTAAAYQANENGTNATITVRRRGGTSAPAGGTNILVDAVASDGTATNGVHYLGGVTPLAFPAGEVFQSFAVPLIDDFEINAARTVNLALTDVQPAGAAGLGNQPVAVLTILNDDSGISFSSANYTRNENSVNGLAAISIIRFGSTDGPASVDFTTTTNGTATADLDYVPVTTTVVFESGETTKTVNIPIINDTLIEGDETVTMELTNVIGALLLAPAQATLTIVDDDLGPGQITFTALSYEFSEGAGNAVVSLVRTNGRAGVVSVSYFTADGTATAGLDYTATAGTVVFGDGETNKSIVIPILNDALVEGPEVFTVTLTNATGGATLLAPTTVPVTIMDDEIGITFSSPVYAVSEGSDGVTITVLRVSGTNSVVTVQYTTTNGTATAGADYVPASGTLTFNSGETAKTFTVPILEDTLVEGDETFGVVLSNPSGGAQLLSGLASVVILDNDAGLGFQPAEYLVDEGGTNVVLTVVRTGGSSGEVSVFYGVAGGSATAGVDFTATSGVLVFTNGQVVRTITVPIIDDTLVEGDETFTVTLSNPTGGAVLVGGPVATVTIIDNDAGISFSSPTYSIAEAGVQAVITVIRSNVLTNTVSVSYATQDGTAVAGHDYVATSGTLVFTNGETSKTFSVTIIDDTLIEGDETILLALSAPVGQASLVSPSAATLTIRDDDGSMIIPAGAALISETGGVVNGAIDPGERVTLWFAFRNAVGTPATNVTATLLATNGITSPTAAQNYGTMLPGGASASRQFAFTASGTNGGTIRATFLLQDAVTNLGLQTFAFQLGTITTGFSNNAAITIPAVGAASPYPSSIAVTGLVGRVSKTTVTLTNLAHSSPDDVDILLVSPAGQKMILMSDAGGTIQITNTTLVFDDAAASALPDAGPIVAGTFKPTNYQMGDSFPSPAPPSPYDAMLSAFNGSNPNGNWSLYVVDDTSLDAGHIANGWRLVITTSDILPPVCDLSVTVTDLPDPVTVSSNVTYVIVVTNHGPSTATGVVVTNALPAGVTFVSGATSQGVNLTPDGEGQVIVNVGTLAKDAWLRITNVVRTTSAGVLTNTTTAVAAESDPHPANNTVVTLTQVQPATADLVLDMVGPADEVPAGYPFIYTMNITNLSAGTTAMGVTLTNPLPAGLVFLGMSASQGTVHVAGSTAWAELGNLGGGGRATVTLQVRALAPDTITNTAVVNLAPAVTDPLKGNNIASVKTVIVPQLSAERSGNDIVLTHPGIPGTVLESTTSLTPPLVWTPLQTNPPPVITLPITNTNRFYRLRPPGM